MDNSPILLSIPAAAHRLSISRSRLYELLAEGGIRSVKSGRRRLVDAASLNQWAANLPQQQLKQSTASKEQPCL
ncbi:excisionase family DNA-binding protein [Acidicapsa acidisoli]|uniref:excisionase family DNA-binding protein n=1 Tax=Acidicapsa acidisoli TaxID=1615681 RepID=UPI0037BEF4A9